MPGRRGPAGLPLAAGGLRGPRGRGSRAWTLGGPPGQSPRDPSGCMARGAPGRDCRARARECQPGETEAPKSTGAARFFAATGATPEALFVPRHRESQLELVPSLNMQSGDLQLPSLPPSGAGRQDGEFGKAGERGARGVVPGAGSAGSEWGTDKGGDSERGKDKAHRGSAAAPGPRRRLRARRSQWAGVGRGPVGRRCDKAAAAAAARDHWQLAAARASPPSHPRRPPPRRPIPAPRPRPGPGETHGRAAGRRGLQPVRKLGRRGGG